MPIFIDPTEARLLPKAVTCAAQILVGLEARTCADIMISTLNEPLTLDDTKISQIRFRKHLDNGILIQRKTTDLVASMPEMKRILSTMLSARARFGAWLLFIGDLSERDGNPMIDGQPTNHGKMNFSLATLLLTFAKWQFRGGYVAQLKYDRMLPQWINGMSSLMEQVTNTPEVVPELHVPQQVILTDDSTRNAWRTTLMTFPDVGFKRATEMADRAGSLKWALTELLDPANSTAMTRKARKWMGLDPTEELVITDEDSLRLWRKTRIEQEETYRLKQKEWDKWVKEFTARYPQVLQLKRSTVEDIIITHYAGVQPTAAITEILARSEQIEKANVELPVVMDALAVEF